MRDIIKVRFMHWKKHSISLIFCLLFPVLATLGIVFSFSTVQEDAKVPVGIVLEEETAASLELLKEIKSTPFLRVKTMDEEQAILALTRHELDSVFVVHDGFEKNVLLNNRNELITGYSTGLSFAYSPVKEMILSYVQQETGRSKAAYVIQDLGQTYDKNSGWTFEEIITKSKEIQAEENLLTTSFSFSGNSGKTNGEVSAFPIWGLWSVLSFLATLLLFDWIIKEKNGKAAVRFSFTRWSLKAYLIRNFIIYTVLLFIIDLISLITLYLCLGEWISIVNVIVFRILLNLAVFLFAQLFKKPFLFYMTSFALTLLVTIISGAILPEGFTLDYAWLDTVNPLNPLLDGQFFSMWSLVVIFLALIWTFRKEKFHA